jgi:hypothetical protein
MGTTLSIGSATDILDPRAAYNPALDQLAIVYGMPGGLDNTLWVQRVRTDGTPIGAPEMVTDRATSWDIAYDSNHYTVAHVRTSGSAQVNVRRVGASSGLGSATSLSGSSGARGVRLARLGATSQLAVVSTLGFQTFYHLLDAPPGLAASLTVVMQTNLPANNSSDPFAVRTQAGAVIGFSEHTPAIAEIRVTTVMPGGAVGGMRSLATDTAFFETNTEAAYDTATDRVALVYQTADNATGVMDRAFMLLLDPNTLGAIGAPLDLGNGNSQRIVANGADSSFGLLLATPSGSAVLQRYRASDLAVVPGSRLTPGSGNVGWLAGIGGSGTHRYLVLSGVAGSALEVQPADCRP